MGVYGLLKNYSRGHDFVNEWKNSSPSISHIKTIGKLLGWNLMTDLIVFEHDCGWDAFVDDAWEFHEDESVAEPAEYGTDTVFLKERGERGWLTLDNVFLEELCENPELHTDPISNIRRCLSSS